MTGKESDGAAGGKKPIIWGIDDKHFSRLTTGRKLGRHIDEEYGGGQIVYFPDSVSFMKHLGLTFSDESGIRELFESTGHKKDASKTSAPFKPSAIEKVDEKFSEMMREGRIKISAPLLKLDSRETVKEESDEDIVADRILVLPKPREEIADVDLSEPNLIIMDSKFPLPGRDLEQRFAGMALSMIIKVLRERQGLDLLPIILHSGHSESRFREYGAPLEDYNISGFVSKLSENMFNSLKKSVKDELRRER